MRIALSLAALWAFPALAEDGDPPPAAGDPTGAPPADAPPPEPPADGTPADAPAPESAPAPKTKPAKKEKKPKGEAPAAAEGAPAEGGAPAAPEGAPTEAEAPSAGGGEGAPAEAEAPSADPAGGAAAEADAPDATAKPAKGEREGIALVAGLQLGPALALTPLSPSFSPRLVVGAELPFAGRRLRVFATGAHARPVSRGEASDPRVPGGTWTWDVKESEWALGAGASVAIVQLGGLVPEVAIAPQLFVLRSRADGDASAAFGETRELLVRGGLWAAPGARYALGPGEATLHLGFSWSPLNGTVTGPSSSAAFVPVLGYQLVL